MNYQETIDYLYSQMPQFERDGVSAYKPGLERITAFCRRLGNPQRNYAVIHIAGTDGKGSVANMLAAILQQAGYQVGLFTSPHLFDFRERIRVNGEVIQKQKVVNFVDKYRVDMEQLGLSFFEMTTALAFDYFAQAEVEIAIIETGLGGRLDSTNIVIPILSVITNVGFDHTNLLGDSLPKIAREKGGIIKKCIPVIVGENNPTYSPVLEEIAEDNNSQIIYADSAFACNGQRSEDDLQIFDIVRNRDNQTFQLRLDLLGSYQKQNLLTVATAADYLHENTPISITRRAFVSGLRDVTTLTGFRGRWQLLSKEPYIVCDAAHNPHGIAPVAEQLQQRAKNGKLKCIMGFCGDKDIKTILSLMPLNAQYIFTSAYSPRAASVDTIAEIATNLGLSYSTADNVTDALEKAKENIESNDTIFIGGSIYLIGELLKK